MKLNPLLASLLAALLFSQSVCTAKQLAIARVFADHAVLQRGVPVPVWGTTNPGDTVTLEFAGQKKVATASKDGNWKLYLAPLSADAAGKQMAVSTGKQTLQINDVLVGEVWYASGQSNMQMTLSACAKRLDHVAKIVSEPKSRAIRTLRIGNPDTETVLSDLPAAVSWKVDTPANRPRQSAVAFFFALELHHQLQVPIGIIEGAWGGKPIEGFIPKAEFAKLPWLEPIVELSDANALEELAQIKGGVIIRNTAGMPGRIFNSRVAPLASYAIKGFIWYQGESNAGKGEDPRNYRHKQWALIEGWRRAWNDTELPFYFVQLPAYKDESYGWIRLREEQRRSLQIANTGMAVTIDLRDTDIHPANKVDVGKRLARWALANAYSKSIPFSGPLFSSARIEGNRIEVTFDHADGGLMVAQKQGLADPVEQKEASVAHVEVCDAQGKWHQASAKIIGKTIIAQSDAVPQPVAVRYACQGDPEHANLYNRKGLPASPFCSDLKQLDWQQP